MPLLTRASDHALSVEQARERTSSYIYGNIIMLTVTVAATTATIEHGSAVVTVLATAVTTFLAHVLAHIVAHRIGETEDHRETAAGILRDAFPIVTSGLVPIVLLAVAWLGWIPASVAQTAASIVLIVRIGLVGMLVQRLSGRRPSFWTLWSGIVVAVLALVIVVLKVVFTH